MTVAPGTMMPIDGALVLTAAQMRAAEQAAVGTGLSLAAQMRRAGESVAAVVRRLSAGAEVLILCGPGNNGGDGWLAATTLAAHGHAVRVAAPLGEPRTELASAALAGWSGPVEGDEHSRLDSRRSPIVIDALFGTGLSRDRPVKLPADLLATIRDAQLAIAVDLPSGVDADTGAVAGTAANVDLTLALDCVKPAHLLQPAAARCGTVRLLPLDIERRAADPSASRDDEVRVLQHPELPPPGPAANKFSRGMVAVVPGPMAGASLLASTAAMRAGAGYVMLLDGEAGSPNALVRKPWSVDALADERIDAVLIGNGLGRDEAARARLAAVLASGRRLVIDADALHLVTPAQTSALANWPVLTPHAGEFEALFGRSDAGKIERTRAAARRSGAVVVFKGADTVIAAPDGRVALAGDASDWLSTAGTGDVLAGTIAAMVAAKLDAFAAAQAGVWLNGAAARRLGAAFIADDLPAAIGAARARL